MIKKSSKLKLYSTLFGLILGLLVAEVGLRIYKYITFHNLDEIEFGNRKAINFPEKEMTLGQIIQFSSHQKIIYELIPNSTYQFRNVLVKTNENGFRDKNYPLKKEVLSKRIIGIGDSGMFGWGVKESDSYLAQLENKLNQSDSTKFEVINTSVPGYNTVMEVAVLEKKIDLTQVDLVIIDFIGNDFNLPDFIKKRPNFWTLKKSFILLFIEEKFIGKNQKRDTWLESAPKDQEGFFESNQNKVPEEYQNMVGEKGYVNAMKKLKTLSENFGFQVLVLSQSPFLKVPEIVTQTCTHLNFEFIDFAPFWGEYKKQNPTAQWKLSDHDWHPTPEGHLEISKVLFDRINF